MMFGDDASSDIRDALLAMMTPDLYTQNAFRVLELRVDASSETIARRRGVVRQFIKAGRPKDIPTPEGAIFPLPHDADIGPLIERALVHLADPANRFLHEFFWFWPRRRPQTAPDPALEALSRGEPRRARAIWETQDDPEGVDLHNLTILRHLTALSGEADLVAGGAAFREEDWVAAWRDAWACWHRAHANTRLWQYLGTTLSGDPGLRTGQPAAVVRETLPTALILVNARLAVAHGVAQRAAAMDRHATVIAQSGFYGPPQDEARAEAVRPIRERIEAACGELEQRAGGDITMAGAEIAALLDTVEPLLMVVDRLVAPGVVRQSSHARVLEVAGPRMIAYGKETQQWAVAIEIAERVLAAVGPGGDRQLNDRLAQDVLACVVAYANQAQDWPVVLRLLEGIDALQISSEVRNRARRERATAQANAQADAQAGRLHDLCGAAVDDAKRDPQRGDQIARRFLEEAAPLMQALEPQLTDDVRRQMHDRVAHVAIECAILHVNRTGDARTLAALLDTVDQHDISSAVRQRIAEVRQAL